MLIAISWLMLGAICYKLSTLINSRNDRMLVFLLTMLLLAVTVVFVGTLIGFIPLPLKILICLGLLIFNSLFLL